MMIDTNEMPLMKRMKRDITRPLFRLLAVLGILLVALAVRLPRLDAFITPDEMKWLCRSINFYRGLRTGNLAQTFQTGHPGVITMWLGAPFAQVDIEAPWLEACRVPAIARIIEENPPELPNELASLLFRARRGVALWTSAFLAVAVWLLARRMGWLLATGTGLLVALDPFYIAHSRFLHLDAIETSLLFPSVLALLEGLATGRRRFLAFSGVLLGLAMLNKSPAMFGVGFAGLMTLVYGLLQRKPFSWMVRTGLYWLIPSGATYIAFWPALWVQPLETVRNVLNTALFYASRPHVNSNYFMGAPRPDPGWAFYPVALAFRLTPWAMVGALVGAICAVLRREKKVFWGTLGLFIALYSLFMTFGEKKFDRYLLPVFPFVQVFAGYGLLAIMEWGLRLVRRATLAPVLTGVLTLGLGLTVLSEAPYYLTYYNPLVGGKRAAVRTLLVGWGEGLDQAAAYLNTLPGSETEVAASRALPGFAPFYRGRAIHQSNYDPATVHYVVFYLNEVQRRLEPELLETYYDRQEPLFVARVKGIDYAWIYENKTHEAVLAEIAQRARPEDAIVVSRPSLFVEKYRGTLNLLAIDPSAPREETLSTLQGIIEKHSRVWYVRYAEKNPSPFQEWLLFQWRTHTRLLERQEFPEMTLYLWDTTCRIPFTPSHRRSVSLDVQFGGELALRGYAIQEPARWDHAVGLTLTWEVLRQPMQYYALYLHVLDDAGHRVGQGDAWMLDASSLHPTVDWQAGATIYEDVAVDLLPGLAPGTYRIVMGVYDRVNGGTLPAITSEGQTLSEIFLGTLEVFPSQAPWSPKELRFLPANREVGPGIRLVGYDYSPKEPAFGETVTFKLAWEATDPAVEGYDVMLEAVHPSGTVVGRAEQPLVMSLSAYRKGVLGQFWRFYDLPIASDALWGEAEIRLSLREGERLVHEPVTVAVVRVRGHRFEEPPIAHRQEARIGEGIRFLGYDFTPPSVRPGETITLTLYWQALQPMTRSLTVFTHLLDEGGVVRGQKDGIPLEGRYPTNEWRAGEYIPDEYALPVDAGALPGTYRIEIGMYDAAVPNAPREPLFVEGVRQPDDRLILSLPVVVAP